MTDKISHPTILLAGVRKCGTTTLFAMLAKHSKIAPSHPKETQFFACDGRTVRENLDWYRGLFDVHNDSVLLDGSTLYFGASEAPELINQCITEPRVILCLRDPAQRVFSGYLHMKKQTPTKEIRPFSEIVRSMEQRVQDGQSLYNAENDLLADAIQLQLTDANYMQEDYHNKIFKAPFPTRLSDKRFSFRYFSESCYSRWLTPWEQAFGDRLHIVYFEDLMKEPESVVQSILNFAGLDYEENTISLVKNNETHLPKGKLAEKLLSYRRNTRIGNFVASPLKAIGFKKIGTKFRKKYLYKDKEKASYDDMARVRALLTDEYAYWKKRDPRTKSLWTGPESV